MEWLEDLPERVHEKALELARDRCARSALHGLVHSLVDDGTISTDRGRFLVALLAKAPPDAFETMCLVEFGQKLSLAEMTLTPQDCWPECFAGITEERRAKLWAEHIERKYIGEQEESESEEILKLALERGWDVLEANRRYPHRPMMLGTLAQRIGRLDQLEQIYGKESMRWAKLLAGEVE